MTLLSVHALSKSYRVPLHRAHFWGKVGAFFSGAHERKLALDDLSFSINEGELVGYIGPNGAGKSSTVKILSGILVPDRGSVSVFGKTPWKNRIEVVRQIGVVFGQRSQLWWDLPVFESFDLLKALYRIPENLYQRERAKLVELLDLSALLTTPVRLLSLGQRMRCDLAASLLHAPKLLFLDEPTIGLDAVSKLAVRDFLRQLNQERKVTILLTTHDMDDIEALCQRVLVLHKGKLYFDGSLSALRKTITPERRLIVDFVKEQVVLEEPEVEVLRQEGHRCWLRFNPTKTPADLLIRRITAAYPIVDLFVENPPIEEIVAQFYEKL